MSGVLPWEHVPPWLIAPPGPQETLRSVLERVYECYGRVDRRWAFTPRMIPAAATDPPIDAMDMRGIRRMAEHLRLPASALYAHRLADGPYLLAERFRRVFCPICWAQADGDGLPRTFRGPVQAVCAITCDRHPATLLHEAAEPVRGMGRKRIDLSMFADREPQEIRTLTAWLVPHAQRLHAVLSDGEHWPSEWRGSARECRLLMIALCLRLVPDAGAPMLEHFRQALGDYSGGTFAATTRVRDPWDAVRMIASPATRRALLWAVLWYFAMPADSHLWPDWLRRGYRYAPRAAPGTRSRDDPRHYGSMEALIAQCVMLSNPARRRNRAPGRPGKQTVEWLTRTERGLQRQFGIAPL